MLEIVGYPDRLAVRPNETIAFKVSCEAGAQQYRADIVRLRCGDDRPGGPGFREEVVDAKVNADYPSRVQPIDCGSYVVVPPSTALDKVRSFTLAALIWPTLPGTGEQTIMGRWQTAPSGGIGYVLGLDPSGRPSLRIGKEGQVWELVARRSLRARRWYRLMASFDAGSGEAALHYEALERDWGDPGAEMITDRSALMPGPNDNQPFTMGAHITAPSAPVQHSAGHFNGKIEAPRLAAAPLAPAEIDDLLTHRQHPALVAAWDFAQDIPTTIVRDAGPNRLDGRCVNLPARGVTGHCWGGRVIQLARTSRRVRRDSLPRGRPSGLRVADGLQLDHPGRSAQRHLCGALALRHRRRRPCPLLRAAGPRSHDGTGRVPCIERDLYGLRQQPRCL
jgi:N,N-dimethylformamidase